MNLLSLLFSSCFFKLLQAYSDVGDLGYDHIVYIGDSILRYQVLAFLYDITFHSPPPTNLTFNDGSKRSGWKDYLEWSTNIFQGTMKCDCYRGEVMGKSKEIFENRYYSHPNGKFFLTYFQKFGDSPAKGKVNMSHARVYNSLAEANEGVWWANTYPDLLEHVRKLSPAPTALVMNQKPWVVPFRPSTILTDLPGAIEVALKIVDTVIWLEGAPIKSEADQMQYLNKSPVDALVKDVLCNPQNPKNIKVNRNGKVHSCIFVPFPKDEFRKISQGPDKYYFDNYHFSDPGTYLRRNKQALVAAGVKHHLDPTRQK